MPDRIIHKPTAGEFRRMAAQTGYVQVVRCKECKHWNEDTAWCDVHSHFIDSEGRFCYPEESGDWLMFDADYFCKDGKRREATEKRTIIKEDKKE